MTTLSQLQRARVASGVRAAWAAFGTHSAAAGALGVHPLTIRHVINREREPGPKLALALATYANVDCKDLLSGKVTITEEQLRTRRRRRASPLRKERLRWAL